MDQTGGERHTWESRAQRWYLNLWERMRSPVKRGEPGSRPPATQFWNVKEEERPRCQRKALVPSVREAKSVSRRKVDLAMMRAGRVPFREDEVQLFGNMEVTGDTRKFISGRKRGAECILEGEEE